MSEINIHKDGSNDFRGIWDNISLFIQRILRHGNCLSLNDVDYNVNEDTFWDIEFFEEYCRNLFFTFKRGFTLKLERKLDHSTPQDLSYFHQILTSNPFPYEHVLDPEANSYQQFIKRKLQSLKKDGLLDEAIRIDKENRSLLLKALKESENKKPTTYEDEVTVSENYDHLPFTRMLRPIQGSPVQTKKIIQDYLYKADITFELFSPKPVKQSAKNSNPAGFNGAVAAMIYTFRTLNYFQEKLSFQEILEAYLSETGNKIGKLSSFKRHYLTDKFFLKYKKELEDILPKNYQQRSIIS